MPCRKYFTAEIAPGKTKVFSFVYFAVFLSLLLLFFFIIDIALVCLLLLFLVLLWALLLLPDNNYRNKNNNNINLWPATFFMISSQKSRQQECDSLAAFPSPCVCVCVCQLLLQALGNCCCCRCCCCCCRWQWRKTKAETEAAKLPTCTLHSASFKRATLQTKTNMHHVCSPWQCVSQWLSQCVCVPVCLCVSYKRRQKGQTTIETRPPTVYSLTYIALYSLFVWIFGFYLQIY